jgi:hypothetical protein
MSCRFERGAQVEGRAAPFALSGQSLQAALQCPAVSAIALLLQLMNEGSDQQIATEPLRRFGAMQLAPPKAQFLRRPMRQFGNLAVDLGHNSAPRINIRVATLTGNRGRPARVLAGRSVVARFHAVAGSAMR